MTEYERVSIEIAQAAFRVNLAADVIAFIALIAAIIGGILAYRNIKVVIWNSLLSFEQDMANRPTRFHEIANMTTDTSQPTDMLKRQYDEAKESYFNSLD